MTTTFAASQFLSAHQTPTALSPDVPLWIRLQRWCSRGKLLGACFFVLAAIALLLALLLLMRAKADKLALVEENSFSCAQNITNQEAVCANGGTCVPACHEAPCEDAGQSGGVPGSSDWYDEYVGWCCDMNLLAQNRTFSCLCPAGFCGDTCSEMEGSEDCI